MTHKSNTTTAAPPSPSPANDPFPARTATLLASAPQFTALFVVFTWLQQLTASQRSKVFKAKSGFESFAASFGKLALANPGLVLFPAGVDPQALVDGVAYIAAQEAFKVVLQKGLQLVEDDLLVTRSELYQQTIDVSTINQRNARLNPSLTADLAAFEQFQAHPKKAKAGKAGSSSSGSTTSSAAGSSNTTTANSPAGNNGGSTTTTTPTPAGNGGTTGTSGGTSTSTTGPVPSGTTASGVPVYTPSSKSS